MILQEPMRGRWPDACENAFEMIADESSDGGRVQLLRSANFTPTSASWLNMVERFFRDITTERLRRGVFTSVSELIKAIDDYITQHNTHPKPFIWTKSARDILQKVIRANRRLSSKQNATLP